MTKIYAVFVGRKPGIYETWEECEAQVARFPNAKFKRFKRLEDAEHYMLHEPADKPSIDTKEVYIEDCPEEILPGWKADTEYPQETQEVLKRIEDSSFGSKDL